LEQAGKTSVSTEKEGLFMPAVVKVMNLTPRKDKIMGHKIMKCTSSPNRAFTFWLDDFVQHDFVVRSEHFPRRR
jgi:hypothetical protein